MIRIEQTAYTYPGTESPVFDHLSLDIETGEVCGILGKNGSGKTTLIKCIAGIIKPQQGSINVSAFVGYVPQKTNFTYDMTVLDAIVMGRYHHFGAFSQPGKNDYEIARLNAEKLGITHLLEKNMLALSGGQQQLALIARALSTGSKCIVFDEPCSALDYGNQNHILSVIKSLKARDTTFILSTHDPNHVLNVADKVLIMRGGSDYSYGPSASLLTDEILSDLYGMRLKNVILDDNKATIVAMFD